MVNILLVTMEKLLEIVMKLIFISNHGLHLTNLIKTQRRDVTNAIKTWQLKLLMLIKDTSPNITKYFLM